MLIHVAQNGKKFELDCQASTSVDVVQKALATLMGVPPAEQMLICRDLRLEPSRTLGHYGLPAEDKHVFLFNRSSLVADAPIPEADLVDNVELELPGEPSRLEIGHPLDESPNPLLRALPSYERQFRYHYQKAQAIWRGSQQRYDLCRQLFAEMEVQAMAIQTARGNMDIYYSHMKQRYDEFTRSCQEQHRKHSDILGNFERDMERLRNTELHPVLKTESRSTLLDCLNDQGIRKWADDCATSHTHFEAKVGELRAQFTGLQRNVEDLKMTEPDVDLEHIEDQMEEHQAAVDEQASILQSLSKDLNTVKKLVEDCVSGQLTSSLRPLDAVAALDPMSEVHINNHLPTVEHCDARLSGLVQHMNKCKVAMTRCVHTQLQSVAALQRRIRDMRNQLVGYREAMQRQEEVFAELLLVRKVASSYRACLAEVVRRKAYAELYTRKAGQLAERMARDRDAEVARREEFMRQQGLLPREILEGMGLSGVPSQCEVNVPTFDSSLLDIDVADLQNLAQIGGVPEERPKSRLGGGSRQLSASMSGSAAMITSTMVGSQKAGAFEGGVTSAS